MDSNKSIIIKNNNLFNKIINFFKRLFKVKAIESSTVEENVQDNNDRKNFLNSIREEQDNPEILKLQQLYESDRGKVEEFSYEQILALNKLYRKQIAQIDEELNVKKIHLNILGKKVAN